MGRRMRIVAAAAIGLSGCRSAAPSSFTSSVLLAPSSDADAAHDELLQADLSRSDTVGRLGIVPGLSGTFTDDAIYLRGGLPLLRGRDAVRAVLQAEKSIAGAAARWQPVRAEVSRDRKSGYTYGFAVIAGPQAGPPVIRVDRYIAFWRRVGTQWKISAYAETYGSPPESIALPEEAAKGVLADVEMSPRGGVLDAIRLADAEFSRDATRSGTGAAFGRYAAADAQVFSAAGEFITGPDAIRDSFGPATSRSSLVWHPVEGEMALSGDIGFTVGNAVFTDERDGAPPLVRYSKYLTVWKKQRDGSWRYVVDGGSARPKS